MSSTRPYSPLSTLVLVASAIGCGEPPAPEHVSVEPRGPAQHERIPGFEEFKAAHTIHSKGRTLYLVEGDVPIASEAALREYYEGRYIKRTPKAIVDLLANGSDNVWPTQHPRFSYCVSTDFGDDHQRAVNDVFTASLAWMDVANVYFEYLPSQDGNCDVLNSNVHFPVRPWDGKGACAFFPTGDGCEGRSVVINYPDTDQMLFEKAPHATTAGIFRHELGHVLGLRHEHVRVPTAPGCEPEATDFRALTPYDQGSVMHYPWCNGISTSTFAITELDAIGMRALYGIPAAWHVPLAFRTRLQ